MLCRIALWDCFGEAIASFIGDYEVAQETWSQFYPPNCPMVQFYSTGSSSKNDSDDNENIKIAIGLD